MHLNQLLELARPWASWSYGGGGYNTTARHIDCCSFTAAVLHRRYGWGDSNLSSTRRTDRWADLCIWAGRDRWSPMARVLQDLGPLGAVEDMVEGQLHLCQGWAGAAGHAWLWLASPEHARLGWVVESSGVGPRLWSGEGRKALALAQGHEPPVMFSERAKRWTEIRVVTLP